MSMRDTAPARGRRVAHLVARFFQSLCARPLDDASIAWVTDALEPGERRVWAGMGRTDRTEAVAVARAVEVALVDSASATDPRWRAAALLHDAGKQLSGYGTFGRVGVTVVAMVVGDAKVRAWAALRPPTAFGSVRARMGRYAAHDDLGAELLRRAGARREIAAWAEAHHRPERWSGTGIPAAVCRILAAADGEPPPG